MGVSVKEIYSPILGYGWENLPTNYAKRQYVPEHKEILSK